MDGLWHIFQAVCLAAFGAASSYLHKWLNGETFTLMKFFATMFVGGFVGLLSYYLAITIFPPGSPIVIFMVGGAGAMGYDAIKPMWERFIEKRI